LLAGACGRRVEDDGVPAESRGFVEAESGGERPHWFVTVYSLPAGAPPSRVRPQQAGGRCETERRLTATQKSNRDVWVGVWGDRKRSLKRGTNPKTFAACVYM
jgi:hypothetical protein